MYKEEKSTENAYIYIFGNSNSPLIHKSQEKLDVSYWLAKNTNSIWANLIRWNHLKRTHLSAFFIVKLQNTNLQQKTKTQIPLHSLFHRNSTNNFHLFFKTLALLSYSYYIRLCKRFTFKIIQWQDINRTKKQTHRNTQFPYWSYKN